MNYFDLNMECLKQVRPRLYSDMKAYESIKDSQPEIVMVTEPSRDGNLYTKVIKDNQEYRLNSNYRPIEEAKRWSKQFELEGINIVVQMFGLGNGYFLRELRDKLKKGDHMIVVEPSYELFQHILMNYDMTDILSDIRISITIPILSQSMFGVLLSQYVHWMNLKSQMKCIHPQYDKCFANEYSQYRKKLDENDFRTLVNRNTEAYFGIDIVKNTIYNYRYLPGSNYLLELRGKLPKEIPAIIVSAGPSLDNNIEELKRAKGKAVIIATDTALRYLHKHGIMADFAVTLDPKKPPSYFDHTDFEQMPMFCGTNANREALCKHHGRKIWFGGNGFLEGLYHSMGHQISDLNTGGSVATAAFSVCKSLGFETIIMVGQDLAYKGNVTHAEGDICKIQSEEDGICYVEGIDGTQIKSRHDWYIYLKWFESSIDETKGNGRVIDATEGGALIHGTELMTLRDAIDQYCIKAIDIPSILDKIPPTFGSAELEKTKQYLKEAYEDCTKLPEQAKKIIHLCDEVLRLKDKPNYSKKIESMAAEIVCTNKEVASKGVYSLLDNYVKHDTFQEIEKMCSIGSNGEDDFIRTYETTKLVFQSVESASHEIEPLLKDALNDFENYTRSEKNVK
ncbi:MAG: DUF115 domain-containing protein [Clostridiales bacterium]|nr:DUF115 domain-containing protein [Clostridiales bacterium]